MALGDSERSRARDCCSSPCSYLHARQARFLAVPHLQLALSGTATRAQAPSSHLGRHVHEHHRLGLAAQRVLRGGGGGGG